MTSKIEWTDETPGNHIETGKYIIVYCPNHPFAKPNGYVFEHRLIMEKYIQRYLMSEEIVHHINFNSKDNRIENLIIMSSSEHAKLHYQHLKDTLTVEELESRVDALIRFALGKKISRKEIECKCGCGGKFITPDSRGRYHEYLRGHNQSNKHWKWSRNNG